MKRRAFSLFVLILIVAPLSIFITDGNLKRNPEEREQIFTNTDSSVHYEMTIEDDGSLNVWGDNSSGQLGTGDTYDLNELGDKTIYTEDDGWLYLESGEKNNYSGIKTIGLEAKTSIAVMNDGSVYAWGSNTIGEIGNGINTDINSHPMLIYEADSNTTDPQWENSIDSTGFVYSPDGKAESNISPMSGYHGRVTDISTRFNWTAVQFEDNAVFSTEASYDDYFVQTNDTFAISSRSFSVTEINQIDNQISSIDFEINGLFSHFDARNLDLSIEMIDETTNTINSYDLEFMGYSDETYQNKYYELNSGVGNNETILSNTNYEITSVTFTDRATTDSYFVPLAENQTQYVANDGFHFQTSFLLASVNSVNVSDVSENDMLITVNYDQLNDTDPNTIEIYSNIKVGENSQLLKLSYNNVTNVGTNSYQYHVFGLKSDTEYDGLIIRAPTNDLLTDEQVIYQNDDVKFTTNSVTTAQTAVLLSISIILLIVLIIAGYAIYYFLFYKRRINKIRANEKMLLDTTMKYMK